jgi:hypothetical protein
LSQIDLARIGLAENLNDPKEKEIGEEMVVSAVASCTYRLDGR